MVKEGEAWRDLEWRRLLEAGDGRRELVEMGGDRGGIKKPPTRAAEENLLINRK